MPGRRTRVGSVVVGALVLFGTVVGSAPASAAEQRPPTATSCFIDDSYRVFLTRSATDAELTLWWQRLRTQPRSRLVDALATSDEWLSVEVAKLYNTALDRDPDSAGLAYWIAQLRAGALVNRVGSLVYGSTEFYSRAGATPEGFVTDLYRRILHRSPDASGLAYWTGQVARAGRGVVAASFFASVESRSDRVSTLYEQILDRSPDATGLAYWVGQLVRANDVRLAVLLASSPEFYGRAAVGCAPTRSLTSGDTHTLAPEMSTDGRYVVFSSGASNLVAGDSNGRSDVFVWDRTSGTTSRITNGNGDSSGASVSADGRYVAFSSEATNLVAGDSNGKGDVFIRDRTAGVTTRITNRASHSFNPEISDDGQVVAYSSGAVGPFDPANVFVWSRSSGASVQATDNGQLNHAESLSADGRHLAYNTIDLQTIEFTITVLDRSTSAASTVPGLEASISADGRYVAIGGSGDVRLWDRTAGTTSSIPGVQRTRTPSISADGRYLAFTSEDASVVPNGESDVFIWDRTAGTTERISDGFRGSYSPSISGDGRYVAFDSDANNLVPGTENLSADIFVWARDA